MKVLTAPTAAEMIVKKSRFLSEALPVDSAEKAREIALLHGTDKILFGSDYPASLPQAAVADVLTMGLSDEDNEKIFHLNAEKLFNLG